MPEAIYEQLVRLADQSYDLLWESVCENKSL